MLVFGSTFDGPEEFTPNLADGFSETPGDSDGHRSAAVPAIWPQIEAEIPFLRRAVRRGGACGCGQCVQYQIGRPVSLREATPFQAGGPTS